MSDYDISSIVSALNSTSTTSETNSTDEDNILGKEAFLELLVTQLEYQDPLDPVDSTEYISQLAQFSSLEQMQNMNDNLSQYLQYQGLYQGSSLIGKTVEVNEGETIGEVTKISFEDGSTYVYIDGEQYSVDDITTVYENS